ncbi:MAG: hypothetical protein IPI23_17405 [Bacteroidetes bacterium]|nr:hypothetical protein [Bacteroidota bacterium]
MTILGAIVAENSIESHIIEHYVRTQEITDRGDELSSADSAFYMERTTGLPTTDGAVYYYGLGNLFIEQHIPIISARHGQQANIQQHDLVNSNNSGTVSNPHQVDHSMLRSEANFIRLNL